MPKKQKQLKSSEFQKRNQLKEKKPYVYDKVIKFNEKIIRGEAIPIIQFQYNYTCNFKCEHCCAGKMQKIQYTIERKRGKRHFRINDIKELSRQADELGLSTFVITGGEPLLFHDLDEVVKAINPDRFWIVIDSNGWLLNDKKAIHLKNIGVDKIQLSLDGADAKTHDVFRRQAGSWKRCINAIKACKKAGLSIILSTVVWKGRTKSKEFQDFLDLAKKYNVGIYVAYAKPIGLYEKRYDQMIDSDDEARIIKFGKKYNIFTHLTPSYGMDIGCIAVKRMISITRYGDILPCPYIHVSLGNFFEEPLKNIIERGLSIKWFNPKYKMPCLIGTSKTFIDQTLSLTYGKAKIPISYKKVFSDKDYINNGAL